MRCNPWGNNSEFSKDDEVLENIDAKSWKSNSGKKNGPLSGNSPSNENQSSKLSDGSTTRATGPIKRVKFGRGPQRKAQTQIESTLKWEGLTNQSFGFWIGYKDLDEMQNSPKMKMTIESPPIGSTQNIQVSDQLSLGSGSQSSASIKQKYKTELCKNWSISRFCKYESRCAFAHGFEELRNKTTLNTFYKTKICKAFEEKNYCPYGGRCQYVHKKGKD